MENSRGGCSGVGFECQPDTLDAKWWRRVTGARAEVTLLSSLFRGPLALVRPVSVPFRAQLDRQLQHGYRAFLDVLRLEVEDVALQADRQKRSAKAGRFWRVSRGPLPCESSENRQVSTIRYGD